MRNDTRLFLALIFFIAAIGVQADDGKSFSKQMNEIKRCGDYVYAESSAPNEADAKTACDALLKIELTKYLASVDSQSKSDRRIIKDIADYNREYLVQPRGDMTRVFGYVAKKDISGTGSAKKAAAKPAEKKKEAPVTDVKTEQPKNVDNERDLPPLTPDVTPMENLSDDSAVTKPSSQLTSGQLHTGGLELAKWQIEMLESILGEPDMVRAKKLLYRYKSQNRIKRMGDRSVSNPREADSFYLIYDSSDKPVALLAPSTTPDHYDMLSGTTVSLNNYNKNQYFWFHISK